MNLTLEKLLAWQDHGFVNGPFVFLNACGTATPGHLLQTMSFPNEILGFGASGVIATACTMPDNFASSFAVEFYRRLLNMTREKNDEGTLVDVVRPFAATTIDIGEAMLQTRLHFLRKHNNPLGLAYGLYAVPYQQLLID